MALRATSYLKNIVNRMGGNRMIATSTTPKMKPFAQTLDAHTHSKQRTLKGEYVPVYVVLGMILLSVSFGMHTAKQELAYGPGVYVKKKRRETLPEVVEPEHVVDDADKFIHKSFFRKVAHIQHEFDDHVIPDPIRGDVFAIPPKAETLKSVGVEPSKV